MSAFLVQLETYHNIHPEPAGFRCALTFNEIPSWIRCKEEGSSVSFQWPLYNSEKFTSGFFGLFFWAVIKARPSEGHYFTIENNNGFKAFSWMNPGSIPLEYSILHFCESRNLNYYFGFQYIKAGEVIKITASESCVVKKIGAGALYRDRDGSIQFVPVTKVEVNR